MTTDLDVLYRDLAEALRHAEDARIDAESIETDSAGWHGIVELAGDIENAANAAAVALEDLAKVLAEALQAVPGGAT